MSFYKVGELSLAVKCFDGGNGITSTLASRLLCGTDLVGENVSVHREKKQT